MESTLHNTVSILKVTKLESEKSESEQQNNNNYPATTVTNTAIHKWTPVSPSSNSKEEDSKTSTKISPNGSNSSTIFCRICHEGDTCEKLLAPCRCSGTVGLIHATCLEHWLTSSNSDKCEICKYAYKTSREPRPCIDYLRDSGNQYNVRNLIADIVCFFLLTPLLVISTYLCIFGAHQYFIRERLEAIGLIILAIFLLAVYLTWCHVTMRFHISVCSSWQSSNQHVRLESLTNYSPTNDVSAPAVSITVISIDETGHNNNNNMNSNSNNNYNHNNDGSSLSNYSSSNSLERLSDVQDLNDCDTSRIII